MTHKKLDKETSNHNKKF